MKNINQIILILSIIGCFALGLYFGILATQKEYERRALELKEKDCFSNRDIEHILYNLPTE
jgi:beta-lactamase regulating signal transducer with metallopeptidase domain